MYTYIYLILLCFNNKIISSFSFFFSDNDSLVRRTPSGLGCFFFVFCRLSFLHYVLSNCDFSLRVEILLYFRLWFHCIFCMIISSCAIPIYIHLSKSVRNRYFILFWFSPKYNLTKLTENMNFGTKSAYKPLSSWNKKNREN